MKKKNKTEKEASIKNGSEVAAKINVSEEIPIFNKQQITTFNSNYVDSYEKALDVLDEDE